MILAAFVLAAAVTQTPTSCINCHVSDLFPQAERTKVANFHNDVHAQVGLSCHDCHGGNPDPNADMGESMDPKFAKNPFIAKPKRIQIPEFCGRCHSSADYMKRFNPAARVDQLTDYRTSMHGQRLAKGDENVATCIDCHSVHDIRRPTNPDGPVYATHVAETCSRCHSDPKRMAQYHIPTDQYARWKISVHANAMFAKNDLTAPTCNDCHSNHGAMPAGVKSVSLVCGNCHGQEAESFHRSKKFTGWEQHNELLASGGKCDDCHDDARKSVTINHFSECISCHENHAVVRPSVAMIGMLPDVPCAFCHEGSGQLASFVAEPAAKASHYREVRDQLLSVAAKQHLTGDARFDWLVDRAQKLPAHNGRPEFARLFDKFRIGKTHYSFRNASGQTVNVAVRRCGDCHVAADDAGAANARHFAGASRGLTSMIARAERIQLAAHRGGVETRQAQTNLDNAVNNQIELETLVHTFAIPEVQKKEDEGLRYAEAALVSAQKSLEELTYRRTGLLIALGIISCVLIGLALKIRTL
jgi:nitrate/TMAO reductase-like tetraheme cytochrome c subunit